MGYLINLATGSLTFSELLKTVGLVDNVVVRLSHDDGERISALITGAREQTSEDETASTFDTTGRVRRLGLSGLTFEWPTRRSTSKDVIATLLREATSSRKSSDPQDDDG